MDDKKYWVWLNMVFGTGSRQIWDVMNLCENAKEAYFKLIDGKFDSKIDDKIKKNIKSINQKMVSDHIKNCLRMGIGIVGYCDEEYPKQLRYIADPPAALYYKGDISCLNGTTTVTAVGTRKPCDYSRNAAYRICSELSRKGCVIVSGFAIGTDITAHMAAVDHGRPTACVLGCGVDVNYPKQNFEFRDRIIESGGVFVSEFPPGAPSYPSNFPMRNRILAALGRVTLVFEAAEKSGSLITANFAFRSGRDVLCLPPADIFNKRFVGNIDLLRTIAVPFFGTNDILDCLALDQPFDPDLQTYETVDISDTSDDTTDTTESSDDSEEENSGEAEEKRTQNEENDVSASDDEADIIKKTTDENTEHETAEDDDMTEFQRRIKAELSDGRLHADVLAERLGADIGELMTELTELELTGIVRSLPGKMFEICN